MKKQSIGKIILTIFIPMSQRRMEGFTDASRHGHAASHVREWHQSVF